MRLRALTLGEAAAVAAALVATAVLGTGLGVAAVRLDGGSRPETPLRAGYPNEDAPLLNRDRARLLDSNRNNR